MCSTCGEFIDSEAQDEDEGEGRKDGGISEDCGSLGSVEESEDGGCIGDAESDESAKSDPHSHIVVDSEHEATQTFTA